jgi:hypothetical protein
MEQVPSPPVEQVKSGLLPGPPGSFTPPTK